MKQVAKLVIIDPEGKHFLMYRSEHPTFGNDPDLPGGTLEEGETLLETMLREVREESGIVIAADDARLAYSGIEYSTHGTHYALFVAQLASHPDVIMSWEHSSYEWLGRADFLAKIRDANDTYMRMVYDTLK